MLSMEQIRRRLSAGQYQFSEHALARVVERNITAEMIQQAGKTAERIEDYPDDKYSPSCLLLGFAPDGTPLHLHVSRADNPVVKIITLYVPDRRLWIDYRIRKDNA